MPYKIENAIIALLMLISVSVKGQNKRYESRYIYMPKLQWTVDTTVGVINYIAKTPDSTFDVIYAYAIVIDSLGSYGDPVMWVDAQRRRHIYLFNGKEFDRTKWYQFIPADRIVNK